MSIRASRCTGLSRYGQGTQHAAIDLTAVCEQRVRRVHSAATSYCSLQAVNHSGVSKSLTQRLLPAAPRAHPYQVLALMIKTFLYHDLLAKARRPKTAGSTVARQKAQERTTPADVWKV